VPISVDHAPCRPAVGVVDATFLLALFLWEQARSESVRVREALAAAIANQVRAWEAGSAGEAGPKGASARALLFAACLDREQRQGAACPPPAADPVFASCRRIAQRAVNGALSDPTGGATRFHRLGVRPAWAACRGPGSLIGPFLFYADEAAAGQCELSGRFVS